MKGRLAAFIGVGALGFILQIVSLTLLTRTAHWPYETATAAAVELAILHNFCWHERWTWHGRSARRGAASRLARFHLGTGCISMVGNLMGTLAFVALLGLDVVAANIAAVALTSFANFFVADRWVFAAQVSPQLANGSDGGNG